MHKVEGNALIYSLFIVLVISTIITLLLMISQYSAKNVIDFQSSIQRNQNIKSGIALLLSQEEFQTINTIQETTLFANPKNQISTKRMQWGLFELIGVKSAQKKQMRYGILGYKKKDNTTLYLTNTNQSLKIAGKTRLEGKCYLPDKGLERATVTGHSYKGDRLIYGEKLQSKKTIPQLKKKYLERFESKESLLDTVVLWNDFTDSIRQSFSQKTIHFISSAPILISQQLIRGNVIVESSKAIKITNQANVDNVVFKAPYIIVENGYQGSLHLQARDSILIGEEVKLDYPSSVLLYDTKSVKEPAGYVKIGVNSSIVGEVAAIQKEYNYRDKISVQIDPKSKVEGTLYANGVISLKEVEINGSVYCQQFNLQTGGSTHSNTLLDVLMSHKKRAEEYLGGNYIENQEVEEKGIINWVE